MISMFLLCSSSFLTFNISCWEYDNISCWEYDILGFPHSTPERGTKSESSGVTNAHGKIFPVDGFKVVKNMLLNELMRIIIF